MRAIEDYMYYAWGKPRGFAWAEFMKVPCPHCGTDLTALHPQANLYPHMTGACAPKP